MIEVANHDSTRIRSKTTIERVLRGLFGYDPETVAFTWNMLHTRELIERGTDIKYMLYMCMYFKGYDTYVAYSSRLGCDAGIFATWVWFLAERVAQLDIVSMYLYMFF